MKMGTLQETVSTGRREKDDLDEEYVLISTLTDTISHGSNDWLVDSGASKHMTRYKESFVNLLSTSHLIR